MNERLTYTVEEAAKVLGISRPTAYMAIQDSKIPRFFEFNPIKTHTYL